jgi:tRNA(fMet)-specific endonuclease VapC
VSRLLFDTSGYSAMQRGMAAAIKLAQTADQVLLNPVVLGELRAGFAAGSKRDQNEQLLSAFLSRPRTEVVGIDGDTSVYYAAIANSLRLSGRPIPANDMWIAASAMQYGLELVTLDRDFLNVNQIIVHHLGEQDENGA